MEGGGEEVREEVDSELRQIVSVWIPVSVTATQTGLGFD